jgi:hypothetical protein
VLSSREARRARHHPFQFPDRRYHLAVSRFFPEARRIWVTFPTVEQVRTAFELLGATFVELSRVREPWTADLAEARTSIPTMRHADTLLAGLTDQEVDAGLARIDRAIETGESYSSDGLDLLRFRVHP